MSLGRRFEQLVANERTGRLGAHWLGHEITALNGVDHARGLTAIVPALLDVRR